MALKGVVKEGPKKAGIQIEPGREYKRKAGRLGGIHFRPFREW